VIYDQNFRQEAAGNDKLQWAKVEPSLYTQCFTGQDISRENWCAKCQGLDHQSVDCPYSAGRKRPWNSGPGAGGHNQLKAEQARETRKSSKHASSSIVTRGIAVSARNASSSMHAAVAEDHTRSQDAEQEMLTSISKGSDTCLDRKLAWD